MYRRQRRDAVELVLQRGGQGALAGAAIGWRVDGGRLVLEPDAAPAQNVAWSLEDDRLVLRMAGDRVVFERWTPVRTR